MPVRHLVQAKLKVWASNPTESRVSVALSSFYLLVPGKAAARQWSPPPGEQWPGPRVISLADGKITAIPANPDGEAEYLGPAPGGGANYSFATHWRKQSLKPHETWHPPLIDKASGEPYPDGTLVFYLPLVRSNGELHQPAIYGLAQMRHGEIISLCPIGRWGKRVSAERF
jgi:hypothetical protein